MLKGLLQASSSVEAQQWLERVTLNNTIESSSPYFSIVDPNSGRADIGELLGWLQLVDAIYFTERKPPISVIHAKLGAEGAAAFSQNPTRETTMGCFQTLIVQGQIIYDFLSTGQLNDAPFTIPRTAVLDAERLCNTLELDELHFRVGEHEMYYGRDKKQAHARMGAFDNTLYIPPLEGTYGIIGNRTK